jgi:hypothetical protein
VIRVLGSSASCLARVVCCAALVVALGCGDDDEGQASRPQGSGEGGGGGGGGKAKATAKAKARPISAYPKVEEEYRVKLADKDFQADIVGDDNRDPFRSYVLGVAARPRSGTEAAAQNDLCSQENSVAPTSSLREVTLIGIVLRGTQSYALFKDRRQYGHIVRRGDCLGTERARVEAIGAGFVRLAVTPEAPPGAAAPPPQTRDIQLHPQALTVDSESVDLVDE